MNTFDVLIIGGGQAGVPLARKLADSGRKVAIAERKHLGGSCVNFGCTPTKAVIASARVAHLARRAAEFGVVLPEPRIDFPRVLDRARSMVEASRAGLAKGLEECHARVLRGHARFTGRDGNVFTLRVDQQEVRAAQVVINTGSRTMLPEIGGLDRVKYLHAGNWLEARDLPRHMIVAGAGYIGLEMAQFYRRMGAGVTVIGSAPQIAEQEDADVAAALQKVLEVEGIEFHLQSTVRSVSPDQGQIMVKIESDQGRREIAGSDLFLATGRLPNTDDLGLETIGLKPGRDGIIEVDDRLSTSLPGVWAAGDIRGGPMFTHTSWDDHRILESQLMGDGKHTKAGRVVPYAVFTDPELGRVGLTETEARKLHGDHLSVVTFEMKHNGKAVEIGEPAGFIKLIADKRDSRLLGAAVLAAEGAELVSSLITLMNARATLAAICSGIYIHPTLSEAIQSAALALKLK